MAQAGFTPIQLYYSTTPGATPAPGDLQYGELALNIRDKSLYSKDYLGNVFLLASFGTSTATVSSVDVSGGSSGLTTSGGPVTTSGVITIGGTLNVANGGTGATDAATARTNLGLGSIATQNANNVAITGGSISGTSISAQVTIGSTAVPIGSTVTSLAGLTSVTVTQDPTSSLQLATKQYVDNVSGTGIHIHAPVVARTTSNLTATYAGGGTTPTVTTITTNNTLTTSSTHGLNVNDVIVFNSTTNGLTAGTPYFVQSVPASNQICLSLSYGGAQITSLTNGTGLTITSSANTGVGATLTNAGAQAALTIDGVSLSINDRVLINGQTSGFQNGVYSVTTVGSGASNWVLTRSSNENTYSPNSPGGLGEGDYFYVTGGVTGAGTSYVMTTAGTIVFGTTTVTFTQFSASLTYNAGTGLTLVGTTFSITATGVTASSYGGAATVPVLSVNAQGQVTSATNTSIAINGNQITSGTVGASYINGSYTNITGVGTLTAGTWNASVIGSAYGGTGVNNGTSTLTMAGNVTHAGAFTQTFTATGNTSVTLPTSGTLSTLAGTETLTNKTVVSRVVVAPDAASITINVDTTDIATQANTQAAGNLTINAPTGTPVNGQKLILRLRSTNVQTFVWNSIFQGSTDLGLPATSTGSSRYDYMGFIYNSAAVKWQIIAKNFGFI